jgi:dUTP pyrophosphatase
MSSALRVVRVHPEAVLPERKTNQSAGYDIASIEEVEIPPRMHRLVRTGIAFTVPEGTYGQLAPRSGLSCKGCTVGAGVIDQDYTGEVRVLLFNLSASPIILQKADRIAQLIIKPIATPSVVEVQTLQETERGEGGFGSTGR